MGLNKIKILLKDKNFLLMPTKNKLDLINNQSVDLNTKIKATITLDSNNRHKIIQDIYKTKNIEFSEEERIILFKSLSYKDKLFAHNNLTTEEQTKYLEYFQKKELMYIIANTNLNIQHRIYIIDNLLTQKERMQIYKYSILELDVVIAIIKHFDEELRRKHIIKQIGQIRHLSLDEYISILCYLPTVEEKLVYLNDNNKYNIKLALHQKIKLIISTNDQEKIKFINQNNLYDYYIKDILDSLTDEGKLKLMNLQELNKSLSPYLITTFYSGFSEELARKTLNHKEIYNLDTEHIEELINCLPQEERLEFFDNNNKYNIVLTNLQKIIVFNALDPQNQKNILKIINNSLREDYLLSIAKKLNTEELIDMLIKHPENYYQFQQHNICKIIKSSPKKTIEYLLTQDDIDIKMFVEKYKNSIINCLTEKEQIDIIYNRSKYTIHLSDNEKINLINEITRYGDKDIFKENIFQYFDNPQTVIETLISNEIEIDLLTEMFIQQLVEFYTGFKQNPEITQICFSIIKYKKEAKEILRHFNEIQLIFSKLNISLLDFVQYGLNSNKYKWDETILTIIKSNKTEEFYNIKNYFFKNYYTSNHHKKNLIENFLELLNAYHNYESFCQNLTQENKQLTEQDKLDIEYLFNIETEMSPTTFQDINKIRNDNIKSYQEIANTIDDILIIKNAMLQLLLGKDKNEIEYILSQTGTVQELNILKFNNKNNKEYIKVIEHIIVMTEFIERILVTEDLIGLKETLKKYTSEEYFETTKKHINYFRRYNEFIRKIYELDVQNSLINIEALDNSFTQTNKALEMAKEYGGTIIDLSESQYVLTAHVKSKRENIENLLTGTSDGDSNFICTSPVSHRGQHYYAYSEYSVVLAYDQIPKDSFICSSIENLGSNHRLQHNTSEAPEFRRVQKGILETSEATLRKNAEMLLYREGIKPCGIIIPTGIKPNQEAIKYHQKYNLPFIITQKIDETIENPKPILTPSPKIDIGEFANIEAIQEFNLEQGPSTERKIAILTDPHALYEPTIACLNDIKSKGITEIYSLGDNIGHGPSPRETLDILKEYNVKSIAGNHELYIIEENAMEIFKDHLIATGALERTTDMTNWIKQEITESQYEELKQYKDKYDIITTNGTKITLIHTTKAYNEEGKYSKPIYIKDSDVIIEGHQHFANQNYNNHIIRAVGIGQTPEDDGQATYAIITIKADSYDIQTQNVYYNRSNLLHTINESSMPLEAKKLIKSWVGKDTK